MRITRRFVLAGLAALAGCGPKAGADPIATVRPLYDPYVAKANPPRELIDKAPWTNEMRALIQRAAARERESGEAIIGYDPIVDGSEWDISELRVELSRPPVDGRAEVRVSFVNLGDPAVVFYDLKQEGGGWRVDNMRGAQWSLRQTLADARITPETR